MYLELENNQAASHGDLLVDVQNVLQHGLLPGEDQRDSGYGAGSADPGPGAALELVRRLPRRSADSPKSGRQSSESIGALFPQ